MSYTAITSGQTDAESPVNDTLMDLIRTNQVHDHDRAGRWGTDGTGVRMARARGSKAFSTSGAVQIAGSCVIAATFPKFQYIIQRCLSENCDAREPPHPAFIVWFDRLNLSLLEHDFRDPDSIRIRCASPRQLSLVGAIPFQQFSECGG